MLKVGFIGCGGIARHHATQMAQIENARIVACADVNRATGEKFAADFKAEKVFEDYRALLRDKEVQAVWVCTPTSLHKAPVIAAAKAGKHVFCEKPMALKPADCERMAAACDKAGVLLTVGFVRRFCPQWGKLKELIQAGVAGRPVIWRFTAGGKPANPWFRDVNMGGGPLMDGAVHNYDYMVQIFGPVASVQASSLQFDATSVGADTASVIVNFVSGDQHTLVWTWGMPAGSPTASLIDVIGPKGSIQFGMTAAKAPEGYDPKTQGAFTFKGGPGEEVVYPYQQKNMFVDQARHVVDCLLQGKQPVVTAADGIAAVRIADAVLRAGLKRTTVKLA